MSDLERVGGDARGYSWPPFEPGNEAAVRAGHRSPRRIDPVVAELTAWVMGLPGLEYLRESRFAPAVAGWARAEATVLVLSDYCAGLSVEQVTAPQGKRSVTEPLELLRRWESTADTRRRQLGLDPVSAAKLQRELVEANATARFAGLDQVREQGRAARERRLLAIDAPADGGDAA